MNAGSPVKKWREEHNIQQKTLAAEMGISPSALSLKETGKRGWDLGDILFLKAKGLDLIEELANQKK